MTHEFKSGPAEAKAYFDKCTKHLAPKYGRVDAFKFFEIHGQRYAQLGSAVYVLDDVEDDEGHCFKLAVLPDGRAFMVAPDEGQGGIAYHYYSPRHDRETVITVNKRWIPLDEFNALRDQHGVVATIPLEHSETDEVI